MQLAQARLVGVGPFGDVVFPFTDAAGRPRRLTIVHGAGGVGKTTLLAALGATRPGNCVALGASTLGMGALDPRERRDLPPRTICEWWLGADDAERPHPLRVATPGARLGESDEEDAFRRREQALFEKRAQAGGFAFLMLLAHRWFSRQALILSAPARTVARYDVRGAAPADEAARADLTRETKQALAYAAIGSALAAQGADRGRRLDLLGAAMHAAVDHLASLAGFAYSGLDPSSFEPVFVDDEGRARFFDALPTRARHLVAFAALPVRVLWGAYPGQDPRTSEAVVAIDECDVLLDPATQSALGRTLCAALPGVQWILTTSSPGLAASVDPDDVIALRRLPDDDTVELYVGEEALTH